MNKPSMSLITLCTLRSRRWLNATNTVFYMVWMSHNIENIYGDSNTYIPEEG